MNHSHPGDTLHSFHERELNWYNAVTVHRELAVAAALEYCAEEGICPPAWAVQEGAELLIRFLRNQKSKKRGRAAGYIARYQQDIWDVERHEAVEAVRCIREKVKKEIRLIHEIKRSNPSVIDRLREQERWRSWLRHGTFECASLYLTGRDARASAHTMRKSFREVRKRAGNGPTPNRYYLFDDRFLRKLGLPGVNDLKPVKKTGKKTFSLYHLVP